ncbi:serine hydrolase domain-containing protein [Silvimonas iriomotensis]|uniref:Beta-lactamase-related domain-containing protein n=1 Tax=Silvimonas iriomotensis TaxID=449662 RepID=A0ABQ2P498_9NEIS|nr:serine hydrolase [Silvimonas iriomotensis]GGP17706.1 hypothetical protein GCM10010970_01070 [Silvimonas iriomotensis]
MKRNPWPARLALLACLLASPGHAAPLPTATPESQGLDSGKLIKMLDYLQTTGFNTDSVVLARHGKVVLEAYAAPYHAGIPHQINSATKSVIATLAGMAIADGKLSLDDTIAKVLPEYAGLPTAQNVTLRRLLQMDSGVNWNEWPGGSDPGVMMQSPEPVKTFLQHAVNPEEIGRFNYNSGGSHLIGIMVARAEGKPLAQFAQERLFTPLGFGQFAWQRDLNGAPWGGRGLYLQPQDLLRLGELYRQQGQWQGQQLLPASWVDYVTSPLLPIYPDTPRDQYYGAQWWVKQDRSSYMAAGWGGQHVIVFPKDDITLALTSRRNDWSGNQSIQLDANALLTYFLRTDKAVLPDNPAASQALQQRILQMADNPAGQVTHSPLEQKISGKAIEVNNPRSDADQWRLEFTGDEVRVSYSPRAFNRPTVHYTVGLDGAWRTIGQGANDTAPTAARATWQDPQTFVLTITPLAEFYIQTFVMKFSGKHVKISQPGWEGDTDATLRD